MRYEIDRKYRIVDFYIEDDSGREHHCGLSFEEAEDLLKEISRKIIFLGEEIEKCPKCRSLDYFQVSSEQLEKEDPEGYKKFGFYSFFQCEKCGTRWLDD